LAPESIYIRAGKLSHRESRAGAPCRDLLRAGKILEKMTLVKKSENVNRDYENLRKDQQIKSVKTRKETKS
jgi:hypothetical protein